MALNQIISSGIGLAAEAIQHHKNKKVTSIAFASQFSQTESPSAMPSSPASQHAENNELPRNVDKDFYESIIPTEKEYCDHIGFDGIASRDTNPYRAIIPKGIGKDPARISLLVEAFLSVHRPLARQTPAPLPYAVIIPQRRPESRDRGFVRAYAPCLAPCGIGEDTFMQFHDFYDESLRYSNTMKVITVAAGAAGMVPSITATIVSLTVGAAAQTAASLQSRQRTNDFLSQMNLNYFMPMGLICLIMKYAAPGCDSETSDLHQAHLEATSQSRWNFGVGHGQMGDASMPLAAPLIFPKHDTIQNQKNLSKFERTKRFIQEYGDRRAQAEFSQKSPDSQLAKAVENQIKFDSFLGDPRNFFSVSMSPFNRQAMERPAGEITMRRTRQSEISFSRAYQNPGSRHASQLDSRVGPQKKKDVLYMMIVPLPTQDQINSVYDEPPRYSEKEELAW